jgi:hypothetical protein
MKSTVRATPLPSNQVDSDISARYLTVNGTMPAHESAPLRQLYSSQKAKLVLSYTHRVIGILDARRSVQVWDGYSMVLTQNIDHSRVGQRREPKKVTKADCHGESACAEFENNDRLPEGRHHRSQLGFETGLGPGWLIP